MVDLEDLRGDLERTAEQAWNSEEAVEFAQDIEDAVPGDLADELVDCATSGQSIRDCFAEKADETNLDDDFESVWSGAPTGLMTQLRQVQQKWDDEAKEAVRSIAQDANLSELNRLCADAEYGDVASQLSLDSTPANFEECVTMVADAQDLRQDLKSAWGTA